ncbi:MAG: hypothetical protein WB471_01425 [Nocardioides sp.]
MTARAGATALLASLLLVTSPPSSQAARDYRPWGTATSKDHVLKAGCHRYAYRYKITAPTDEWMAEIRFIGPNGTGLASSVIDSGSHPARDKRRITVCQPSTSYGKHTIKMKVTYSVGVKHTSGQVKPTSFRFLARR